MSGPVVPLPDEGSKLLNVVAVDPVVPALVEYELGRRRPPLGQERSGKLPVVPAVGNCQREASLPAPKLEDPTVGKRNPQTLAVSIGSGGTYGESGYLTPSSANDICVSFSSWHGGASFASCSFLVHPPVMWAGVGHADQTSCLNVSPW